MRVSFAFLTGFILAVQIPNLTVETVITIFVVEMDVLKLARPAVSNLLIYVCGSFTPQEKAMLHF